MFITDVTHSNSLMRIFNFEHFCKYCKQPINNALEEELQNSYHLVCHQEISDYNKRLTPKLNLTIEETLSKIEEIRDHFSQELTFISRYTHNNNFHLMVNTRES